MIPKPLAVAIVCLVTVVWAAAFVAQFLVPGYQMDGWIHSIFLTVVGGALGLSRKGGGSPPPPDPAATPELPEPPPAAPAPAPGPRHAALALLPWRLA